MLGFVISTVAFSASAFGLNKYFNRSALQGHPHSKLIILVIATVISIGAGWITDKLDSDADLPQNNLSILEVMQSGDPLDIAKRLIGIP